MFGLAGGKTKFCLITTDKKAEILSWMEKIPLVEVESDENEYVAPEQQQSTEASVDAISAAMASSDRVAQETSAIFDEGQPKSPPMSVEPGPSFNCRNASTEVETMICSDETLSGLDRDLAKKYKALARAGVAGIKESQIAWTRKRNACSDKACVGLAYTSRIRELEATH